MSVKMSCLLQTSWTCPTTALCSTLTCRCVWTDKRSPSPRTWWTSCWPNSWQLSRLCCRRSCRSWAGRTSGCGRGRSSDVSVPPPPRNKCETSRRPGSRLCLFVYFFPPDSLSRGYYQGVSAPPGFMALLVPCQLGEVELALAFEMFVTVNGSIILHASENTSSSLSITLKR